MFRFVEETQGLDFAGAIEWLADRFRIPIEYEESGPGEDARRQRRKRLYELLDQAATFYERLLWDSPGGSLARDYLAGRGLREEVCREFRLGLAPGGGLLTRKAREKGFTADELHAAGLSGARGDDFFQRRLLFPARRRARPRRRLPGAAAARGRPAESEVRQHARIGALRQGGRGLRARQGARGDREGGPRLRRRGEHRRDRVAPGRIQARRRVHGNGAHRSTASRARPADETSVACIRRRRRRCVGDAARDGARRRPGLRRQRRVAAAGSRSRRRSGELRLEARRCEALHPPSHPGGG